MKKTDYKQKDCKDAVWNKGIPIINKDPNKYRFDAKLNIIKYDDFGKDTETGWNIDHILAIGQGGDNSINNLQPLQTKLNKSLGKSLHKPNINSYKGLSNEEINNMYK